MSLPNPRRSAAACALAVVIASCCAGCGRKGALEAPPGAAVSVPTVGTTGSVQDISGNGSGLLMARPKKTPILPPKTPFILDPLV